MNGMTPVVPDGITAGSATLGKLPEGPALRRTASSPTSSGDHLRLLAVLPLKQVLHVGFVTGMGIPMLLLTPFLLALVSGVVFVGIAEGLLGIYGLEETAWEFIVGSLKLSWELFRPYLSSVAWILVWAGLLGSSMTLVAREAFRRRTRRTMIARLWQVTNQYSFLPYLSSAAVISWYSSGQGFLSPLHLIGLGLMLGWVPAYIVTQAWTVCKNIVLSWYLTVVGDEVKNAMLSYQIRAVLDCQGIDPSVNAIVDAGRVYLVGSVKDNRERRDAVNSARDVKGASDLVSCIKVLEQSRSTLPRPSKPPSYREGPY